MRLLKSIAVGALFVSLLGVPAFSGASQAWTTPKTNVSVNTATTGSESAPTLVTEGLALARVGKRPVTAYAVHAESPAGAMTVGGKFLCYLWNPISAQWNRASDLDITVILNIADETYTGFIVGGAYTGSRVAFIPSGVGVAVTITILATTSTGRR